MSDRPEDRTPSFLALNPSTVRLNPYPNVERMLLEIMQPPQYKEDGAILEPYNHIALWLHYEEAKKLADLIYAQLAMKYVSP